MMDKRRQMMAEALKDAVERAERTDHVVRMSTEVAGQLIEMLGASGSGYADRVAPQGAPLQEAGAACSVAAQVYVRFGKADREKVIRGLTCCQTINEYCDECPYNRISYDQCTKVLIKEALELLKAQPEIVRCSECIRRASYDCPIYQGGDGMHDEPDDWFCGDGERRV